MQRNVILTLVAATMALAMPAFAQQGDAPAKAADNATIKTQTVQVLSAGKVVATLHIPITSDGKNRYIANANTIHNRIDPSGNTVKLTGAASFKLIRENVVVFELSGDEIVIEPVKDAAPSKVGATQ